jgi:hypothetical protein
LADPFEVVRFRGLRQLVGNLVAVGAGTLLFVILSVAVIAAPPSTGRSGEWWGLAISLLGLLVMVGLLIRMRSAFSVELEQDTLIYRTLLRTIRIARSDIAAIGLRDRNKGLAKLSQPFLELKTGTTLWLADMGQGKLIAPTSSMQAELVEWVC